MHTQLRNRFEARGAARFWKGVAQITRGRDRTFIASICFYNRFLKGSVLRVRSPHEQPEAVFSTSLRFEALPLASNRAIKQNDSETRKIGAKRIA
jgi:hypothetical protein